MSDEELSAESIRDQLCSGFDGAATREIVLAMVVRAIEVVHENGSPEATRYAVMQAVYRAASSAHNGGLSQRRCDDYSPSWFTGRWQDWHRGHGCGLDDRKPRTEQGAAEIATGGR